MCSLTLYNLNYDCQLLFLSCGILNISICNITVLFSLTQTISFIFFSSLLPFTLLAKFNLNSLLLNLLLITSNNFHIHHHQNTQNTQNNMHYYTITPTGSQRSNQPKKENRRRRNPRSNRLQSQPRNSSQIHGRRRS